LITDKEKMSKSSGDFLTLDVVRKRGFTPLDYRFFCLGTNYRSPLTFSWDRLEGARSSFKSLAKEVIKIRSQVKTDSENGSTPYETEFLSKVNDDLNLPGAMAVVWSMIKSDLPASQKYSSILKFDKVLGLGLGDLKDTTIDVPLDVMDLVERRNEARKVKDWELADQLRKEIASKGFSVDDTETGFRVNKQE
jgi:cysteinyl-tRNA synthetase